jgi:hypothetical protein
MEVLKLTQSLRKKSGQVGKASRPLSRIQCVQRLEIHGHHHSQVYGGASAHQSRQYRRAAQLAVAADAVPFAGFDACAPRSS